MTIAERRAEVSEQTFTSWDGTQLFYRAWLPEGTPARAVLLFHRGHEHSGRWRETAEALRGPETAVFGWDQRGHGRSPGVRGHAPNMVALIRDADCFARHVTETYGVPLSETALVASSVGAVVAAAWVHDFAPPLRAMVLAAPALRVKLYVPWAVPLLRMREKLWPGGKVWSYVKSLMLTSDAAEAAAYDADPLVFRQIPVNVLLDLHDAGTRLVADAAAIRVPTLILAAGKDWVVKLDAQRRFFERLGPAVKQMEYFPACHHALYHERERARVIARTRAFIDHCFTRPAPDDDDLLDADRGGFTRTEVDVMRLPSGWRWRATRGILRALGLLSEGLRIGWRSGFDSGLSLDYVYENRPRGRMPLGRLIDRLYLNNVGWRGVRVRRQMLERLLRQAIERAHADGRTVHILDIASGPGRYVLETMHAMRHVPMTALLRDYKDENCVAARKLAARLSIDGVTVERDDAFDRAALAAVRPRPTVAIASGLYELFADNAPVRASLRGIADALEPGGWLLYTCQPWHPQLEFIARTLRNREGKPWVMRRRTQAEMDALVRAAGFEKVAQDIDPAGIFTVSLARRVMP